MKNYIYKTVEGGNLWFAINNYFFSCDDPKYSKLHQYRNKIMEITNQEDKEQLVKYFEMEAGQKIDYFAAPY